MTWVSHSLYTICDEGRPFDKRTRNPFSSRAKSRVRSRAVKSGLEVTRSHEEVPKNGDDTMMIISRNLPKRRCQLQGNCLVRVHTNDII